MQSLRLIPACRVLANCSLSLLSSYLLFPSPVVDLVSLFPRPSVSGLSVFKCTFVIVYRCETCTNCMHMMNEIMVDEAVLERQHEHALTQPFAFHMYFGYEAYIVGLKLIMATRACAQDASLWINKVLFSFR